MANTTEFIGQGDASGQWFSSTIQYFGPVVFNAGATPAAMNSWMFGVYMFTRDYWSPLLATPYAGQLFPTGGSQNGPGQIYPF